MNLWNPEAQEIVAYFRDACEQEGVPELAEVYLNGPSDGSAAPVWESKPLYRMSGAEFRDTLAQIEHTRFISDEHEIRRMASVAADRWSENRNLPDNSHIYQASRMLPMGPHFDYFDENMVIPETTVQFQEITLYLPPYIRDQEQAEWLAERQIREQWKDHL